MRIEIHITIKSDDGQIQEQEQIACPQRGTLTPEELGINLAEAKYDKFLISSCFWASNVRNSMVRPIFRRALAYVFAEMWASGRLLKTEKA